MSSWPPARSASISAENCETKPGWFSKNWLTPVVHEQYGFWMPSLATPA